jgi:hypothetical protein
LARDGSGNYTLPANTQAVSGDPISSTKYNTLVQDLEADANTDRPIVAGGTGASTAAAARTNLGLAIGTDVQAFDAGLLSIAGLTTLADRSIYTTASDTYAVYTLTAAGRAILDDADAAAQRTTLGLAIGTDVQAFDQQLLDIAALAVTDSGFIVGNGTTFVLETGSTAQTSLGYTAADVLTKLLTVDGAGSGLDADLLDGVQPSAFALTILDDADASAARTTLGLANGATTTISAFALTMLDDVDAAAVRTTIGVGLGTGDLVAANNLSDVANASTARTNLGLAIGTNVQAYDAGLQSIAGLTTEADRGIYTTASDTYAVYTLTAAGRAILDDADAAAQRTTLGLGTAALKNTGTSGDAVGLLNTANTWSAAQGLSNNIALNILETGAVARSAVKMNASNVMEWGNANNNASFLNNTVDFAGVGNFTRSGNAIWHAGNDGAGSGLDADTLDGVQGSAYAALAGVQTFTGLKNFQAGAEATNGARITNTATSRRLHLYSGKVGSQNGDLSLDAEDGNTVNIQTSGSNRATFNSTQATFTVPAQIRPAASTETTGTLTSSSSNKTIQATGDITIPNAVFAAGDIILIYAGASSRTITEGASVTMRLGGTATTGSRTLAARGVAVLFFVSSSEVVVSGGAVT